MFNAIKKASEYAGMVVVIAGLVPVIMNLIKEVNEVIDKRKAGEEKKDLVMQAIRTILVELDKLMAMELPIDAIMNIVDKLIEIIFSVLKITGVIEH